MAVFLWTAYLCSFFYCLGIWQGRNSCSASLVASPTKKTPTQHSPKRWLSLLAPVLSVHGAKFLIKLFFPFVPDAFADFAADLVSVLLLNGKAQKQGTKQDSE